MDSLSNSTEQEKRKGQTGIWTKLFEQKDLLNKLCVVATPDWSSNSWVFDKEYWEKLPLC